MPSMRALQLLAEREVAATLLEPPAPPGPDEVQIRIRAVGLNHIDVWGFRGMAFAKRLYPLVVGAEAAGEVVAVGEGVTGLAPGDRVVPYAALVCGTCKPCRTGRENLCENVRRARLPHRRLRPGAHQPPGAADGENPAGRGLARRRLRAGCLRDGRTHAVR